MAEFFSNSDAVRPGPWIPITAFGTGWVNAGAGGPNDFAVLSYRVHPDNTVELRGGAFASGGAPSSTLFTVPTIIKPFNDVLVAAQYEVGLVSEGRPATIFSSSGNVGMGSANQPAVTGDQHTFEGVRYNL
jgi:hypothetical protein